MIFNPYQAVITEHSNVTQFRLRYSYAGNIVAEVVVGAVPFDGNMFAQPLQPLNVLVPVAVQGAELSFTVSAINEAGESAAFACPQTVRIINVPDAPTDVTV